VEILVAIIMCDGLRNDLVSYTRLGRECSSIDGRGGYSVGRRYRFAQTMRVLCQHVRQLIYKLFISGGPSGVTQELISINIRSSVDDRCSSFPETTRHSAIGVGRSFQGFWTGRSTLFSTSSNNTAYIKLKGRSNAVSDSKPSRHPLEEQ
jgi:hypothetical protein